MMDYKNYINKIQLQLNQMTEAQKTEWIYAKARVIAENDREAFLKSLTNEKNAHLELRTEEIENWCDKIECGEIYLKACDVEYYNEGDWDSDFETEYYDIFNVAEFLEKVINSCEQMMEIAEYKQAYALLNRVCFLHFQIQYDEECDFGCGYDFEGLSIERLKEEQLVSIDLENLALCLLYTCYQVYRDATRNKKLYEHLMQTICHNIVMTDVFSFGPKELKQTEAFMEGWCEYLICVSGNRAAELLDDACIFLGGSEYKLKIAEENYKQHPYLFYTYCQAKYQAGEYAKCLEVATKAMGMIDKNKAIRADISEVAVKAVQQVDDKEAFIRFCNHSFQAKPTRISLLRLYALNDKAVLKEGLMRLKELPIAEETFHPYPTELSETVIKNEQIKIIYRFLLGEYKDILRTYEEGKPSLEWGFDIKREIILLLLLCLKEDKERKTKAERNIIDNIKTQYDFAEENGQDFDLYFSQWRQSYTMPPADQKKYICWLIKEIDKYVENIVGGAHRSSYYKAAELIVMIGSIREEHGEAGAMQALINHYKMQHNRKRAFKNKISEMSST